MSGSLQPLDQKFAIVDERGMPTEYFIRWAQQKQIDIGDSLTLTDLQDFLTAHMLVEGSGIQFTPDGDINNSPTIAADVQEILDQVTATRGAVLYRGLLGWAALLPGTAGLFLQTSGAGADPIWAAAGGGSSTPWYINTPLAATFTKASGDATQLILTDSPDVGIFIDPGAPVGGQISRIAYKTLTNKALAWEVIVKLQCFFPNLSNTGVGLYLMDSISGRSLSFDFLRDGNVAGVFQWNPTLAGFSASPFSFTPMRPVEWVRITSDGTTLSFQISDSGKQWNEYSSQLLTSWLTNKPDRIGVGSNTNRVGPLKNLFTLNYFTLTGPGV